MSPVALAALVALALPATPLAAQSALPTVIHACYVPSTGTVYRIKAPGVPDSCGSSKVGGRVQEHVPFEWNQQGPPGPVGPQGPQGVQGPPGPAGAGGTAAPVLLFNQRNVPINTAAPLAVTQTCPDGKRIIDRGYLLLDASGEPLVLVGGVTVIGDVVSAPPTFSQGEPPPRGQSRTLMIVNPGPRVVEVRMQLTCATVE